MGRLEGRVKGRSAEGNKRSSLGAKLERARQRIPEDATFESSGADGVPSMAEAAGSSDSGWERSLRALEAKHGALELRTARLESIMESSAKHLQLEELGSRADLKAGEEVETTEIWKITEQLKRAHSVLAEKLDAQEIALQECTARLESALQSKANLDQLEEFTARVDAKASEQLNHNEFREYVEDLKQGNSTLGQKVEAQERVLHESAARLVSALDSKVILEQLEKATTGLDVKSSKQIMKFGLGKSKEQLEQGDSDLARKASFTQTDKFEGSTDTWKLREGHPAPPDATGGDSAGASSAIGGDRDAKLPRNSATSSLTWWCPACSQGGLPTFRSAAEHCARDPLGGPALPSSTYTVYSCPVCHQGGMPSLQSAADHCAAAP